MAGAEVWSLIGVKALKTLDIDWLERRKRVIVLPRHTSERSGVPPHNVIQRQLDLPHCGSAPRRNVALTYLEYMNNSLRNS